MNKQEESRRAGTRRRECDAGLVFSRRKQYTTKRPLCQPVHGRIVGHTWRKRVQASRHFLRRPPAIAVDVADLEAAEAAGAAELEIEDSESRATYWCTIERFRAHGFAIDRGHGRQVALPLSRWVKRTRGEPAASQLALFGEVAQ